METFTITKFDDHILIKSNLSCVRVEPSSVKGSIVVEAGGDIETGYGGIEVGYGGIFADVATQ